MRLVVRRRGEVGSNELGGHVVVLVHADPQPFRRPVADSVWYKDVSSDPVA